jgi:predicted ATPase
LVAALRAAAFVHLFRREGQEAQAHAEALLTLAHEHGFAGWLGDGTSLRGWALVERAAQSGAREQGEAGLVQLREGLAAFQATGEELFVPLYLGAVAQGYAQGGQAEEGLRVVAEALALVEKNEERWNEAELYRIKGELTLQQANQKAKGKKQKAKIPNPQHPTPSTQAEADAEACFLKAVEIAQRQQAKSLELRATVSLARLWQSQGKSTEAHQMLSKIYNWFTEGLDTKDLQEAQALLDELSH